MKTKQQILTNQIGYDTTDTKNAIFQAREKTNLSEFQVLNYDTDELVLKGIPTEIGTVDNWQTGFYYTMRFDEVNAEGDYYIVLNDGQKEYKSFPFHIGNNWLEYKTMSSVCYYFKTQRPTGEFEKAERNLPFRGEREGRYDVRGGWFDATGDYGIHLSHLSHTSFFNPQQASFSAYSFFKMNELLTQSDYPHFTMLKRRMLDEGMYGADFLMRMRAPSGTFFRTKDRAEAFKPVNTTRVIGYEFRNPKTRQGGGVLEGFDEIVDENYEVSFRCGGGYAIATLAIAARHNYPSDFSKEEYIQSAINAYNYLEKNNERYTNDGKWNLLDEYCCLDALIEIYKTTQEIYYLYKAREIYEKVEKRYVAIDQNRGYLSVDGTNRPFFHAADAGMPAVNILNFYAIEKDVKIRERALNLAKKIMANEIFVTNETSNPFGYARQLIKDGKGTIETRFFYPHDVETSPWWQGENARIASLATAARSLSKLLNEKADEIFKSQLKKYADDQINWILGLNPYDSCMMESFGRNNPAYFFGEHKDFIHCPGGIVNGITGGIVDEEKGIDLINTYGEKDITDNWRWAEQWIPHATWYLMALTQKM